MRFLFKILEEKMYYSMIYASPVGRLTLASDGDNLVGLWIEGQKYFGGSLDESMIQDETIPALR